jgi:hypothetical protein
MDELFHLNTPALLALTVFGLQRQGFHVDTLGAEVIHRIQSCTVAHGKQADACSFPFGPLVQTNATLPSSESIHCSSCLLVQ